MKILFALLIVTFTVVRLPAQERNALEMLQAGDSLIGFVAYDWGVKNFNCDYDSLRTLYQLASEMAADAGDDTLFITASTRRYWSYSVQRNYEEALKGFQQLQEDHSETIDKLDKEAVLFYDNLAWAHYNLVEYPEASVYYQKALDYLDRLEDKNHGFRAKYKYFIGSSYRHLKMYNQAVTMVKAALDDAMVTGHLQTIANAYNTLGILYRYMGEYNLSLEYYQEALKLAKQFYNNSNLSPLYNNIGIVYNYLGEHEKAIETLNIGLELVYKETSDYYPINGALYNALASVYNELGDSDKALDYISRSVEGTIGLYGEKDIRNVGYLTNLARTYVAREEFDEALNTLRKAEEIIFDFPYSHVFKGEIYQLMGNSYAGLGQFDQCLAMYQSSLASYIPEFEGEGNPALETITNQHLEVLEVMEDKAQVYDKIYASSENLEDLRSGYDTRLLAVELIDVIRNRMLENESKLLLAEKSSEIFENAIVAASILESGTDEYGSRIFDLVESNKSFLLRESVSESLARGYSLVPDSLQDREINLRRSISYYEKRIFDEYSRATVDSTRIRGLNDKLFGLKRDHEALTEGVRTDYPEYYDHLYVKSTSSVSELQNSLSEDDLFVEYFAGQDSLFVVGVTKGEVTFRIVPGWTDLKTKILSMLEGISSNDMEVYARNSHDIYVAILEPELEGKDITSILVIPDDVIGLVSFDALLTNKPGEGANYANLDYLIKDYLVSFHYSADLMLNPVRRKDHESSFVGYAPRFMAENVGLLASRAADDSAMFSSLVNLPQAEAEVKAGAEILSGIFRVGADATETNFKSNTSGYRTIHIASHALINHENPLYSRLVFAPENDTINDGMLHTYELYDLNINADLVCLSACNTGVGKYREGEGVISMARGFMVSGVPNVVMSLWSVADQSTSDIMKEFYTQLEAGKSKGEALRDAKLAYLERADEYSANPYLWSALVYLGSPEEEGSSFGSIYLLLIFLPVFLVIFLRRKKPRF